MSFLKNTLTVDPGFGGTGWAYWKGTAFPETGLFRPESFEGGWKYFSILLDRLELEKVIIECVEARASSPKSYASVLSGDLFKLSTLLSGYAAICFTRKIKWEFIHAFRWKGQLPDDVVNKRIFRINGMKYRQHESSAVGMGFGVINAL